MLLLTALSVPLLRGCAVPALSPEETKYVALSFDDGPSPLTTPLLLDGLAERGVHATFFVLGMEAEKEPELLRRMAEEGHQIGQHSYGHGKLNKLSDNDLIFELQRADSILQDILGEGDYWIRPPYGLMEQRQYALAGEPLITWSVDPQDWKLREKNAVTRAVLTAVRPGDIILMHDIYESSVKAALAVIDALQAEGYRFVTVRELMELYGVKAEAGKLYRSARDTG